MKSPAEIRPEGEDERVLPSQPISEPTPLPSEPLPAEDRRLPKVAARPAPVLALLRARWTWLVITGLVGAALGLVLGSTQQYTATATLRLVGMNDSFRIQQVAQTYEIVAVSPQVIDQAAKAPALAGIAPEQLGPKVKALWVNSTDLIQVTVTDPDGPKAVEEANAVVDAVVTVANTTRDARLAELKGQVETAIGDALTGKALAAEAQRRDQLGKSLGDAQMSAILESSSIAVDSKAAAYVSAGASSAVSAALGGAAGIMLGSLAALLAGAGRRRVRTPNELKALAPELTLRATTQAGEVAGRLLESGHSTLVVLSLPSTPSSASRFAAAVANHLRTHGSSVTLVNAIALESSDSSSMALPDEVWVLRRDIRQDVKAYFSTDVLVVACTAEPEAVGLISGQSDLMAVVVAKEGRSNLQQIWDAVGAVEAADPIVVLAP